MSGRTAGPPRLHEALLARVLPAALRGLVLGDLAEEFARRRRRGPRRARWWYRVEVWRSIASAALHRFRRPVPGPPRSENPMHERILFQLRGAARALTRSPGFTLVAGATLVIAVGVNTALFSVVKQVLLDPLPYPDPDRVVAVWQYEPLTGRRARVTPGNYTDLRDLTDVFAAVGIFAGVEGTLTAGERPELLQGARVSASYFDVLGVPPLLGRPFRRADEGPGGPAIVMLSERTWATRFGADSSLVGRTVTFGPDAFEVVGVMPDGLYPAAASIEGEMPFASGEPDFWMPVLYSPSLYTNRRPHILGAIARLRTGVTFDMARSAVDALGMRIASQSPNPEESLTITPLFEEVVGGVAWALTVLAAAVGLVLVVAASNVAGLFLVRSESRRREMLVRMALGARRRHLVGQLAAEIGLLAVAAGVLGFAVGAWVLDAIKALAPIQIPRLADASLDAPVLLFTMAASFVSVVAAGMVPAWLSTRPRALERMRDHAPAGAGGRHAQRTQRILVTAQVAVAVVLMVGAGLLVRSFRELLRVDNGFTAEGLIAQPLPSIEGAGTGDRAARLDQLARRLRDVPGLLEAAVASNHPLQRTWSDGFVVEGRPRSDSEDPPAASLRGVTPAYFATIAVPVLEGRDLNASDANAAVINAALAVRYFPDGSPVGRRIAVPSLARIFGADAVPEAFEIVGVVGDVRFLGPDAAAEPALYLPLSQFPVGNLTAIVRTAADPSAVLDPIRDAIEDVLGVRPTREARTMTSVLDDFHVRPRFNMVLLMSFAAIALGLTILGVFGLVARTVALRTRDIGVRMALGASRHRVLGDVLWTTARAGVIGLALGTAGAAALARAAQSLLFGVPALDPVTYLTVPVALLGILLLAGLVPASRAIRIDPARTVRAEN